MTTLDKMLQGLANALGASLSTLTTTAKTVVGAINELKSGLTTANTNISTNTTKIGSGSLNTTSQTLIGAVNELVGKSPVKHYLYDTTVTVNSSNANGAALFDIPCTHDAIVVVINHWVSKPTSSGNYPSLQFTNGNRVTELVSTRYSQDPEGNAYVYQVPAGVTLTVKGYFNGLGYGNFTPNIHTLVFTYS